jgi:hypothetical protein
VGSWRDAYQRWKQRAYPPLYKALPADLENASEFERWRAQYHKWRVQQYGGDIPPAMPAKSSEGNVHAFDESPPDKSPLDDATPNESSLRETPANWGEPFGRHDEEHTGMFGVRKPVDDSLEDTGDDATSHRQPFQASNIVPFGLRPALYRVVDGRLLTMHDHEGSIPPLASTDSDTSDNYKEVSAAMPLCGQVREKN